MSKDLFKEVLPKLDAKDIDWVLSLSEDDLKSIAPLITMKFMSGSTKNAAYNIIATNEVVNKGFWELYGYKDLQLMLLCLCGSGKKEYHYFPGKLIANNEVFEFVSSCFPLWKDEDIEQYIELSSAEDIYELAKDHGLQDNELKKLKKELKC